MMVIDEEETENDGTAAEAGASATRSSSVSEVTFDKSLPRIHAVSMWVYLLFVAYLLQC